MAAEEEKLTPSSAAGIELQEQKTIANPAEVLQKSLSGLDKFGGFQLLKGLIKGVENMDPRRKAIKNVFLNDTAYADARKRLQNELELWIDILESGGKDPMEIIEACKGECQKAERNLSENLFCIHDEIRNLEVTYRSLDAFFANAGQGKVDCITLMNINKEELNDNDSEDTLAIRDELERYFDRLNLKNNYSLLVIPGYLGDAGTIRMWAQTAYRNKVIMVTDFKDSMNFEMLKEELQGVLGTLTDREEKVLRLRFGLDDGQCRTLEEVGQIFGVTRERIRQIEAKALRKLRHPSRSRKLKDFLTD